TELAGVPASAATGASSGQHSAAEGSGDVSPPANPPVESATGGGSGDGYGGGGVGSADGGGGGSGANKGKQCASDADCGGEHLACGGRGVCKCRFPWQGKFCQEDACLGNSLSCDACHEFNKDALPAEGGSAFLCVWAADEGTCRSSPSTASALPECSDAAAAASAATAASSAAAAAAPASEVAEAAVSSSEQAAAAAAGGAPSLRDPQQQTPTELLYTAGLPLLVVVLVGGLLVFVAKCVRKCSRGGSDGPNYTPVDTANVEESSGGEWAWDGEQEDDIEMPPKPSPPPTTATTTSAGGGRRGGGSRAQPGGPMPGSRDSASSMVLAGSASQDGAEAAAAAAAAAAARNGASRPSKPGMGAKGGGGRGRRGGRGAGGGAARAGQQSDSTIGILADDDLFAELGIEAKPTFREKKSRPGPAADRSLALQASEATGGGASWVDDDLDDLLK
ncbi:unnamed protein product, partial [Ectocarpus sp. 12 AP-2014]